LSEILSATPGDVPEGIRSVVALHPMGATAEADRKTFFYIIKRIDEETSSHSQNKGGCH
jgi:hypothetical protein